MQKHEEWLFIATIDLESARLLGSQENLIPTALYHTQQCAEKSLKGYLAFKQQQINKIHDLVALIKECRKIDESFAELLSKSAQLKPYITQSRYPDDYVESNKDDIKIALENATYIFEFVRNKLSI